MWIALACAPPPEPPRHEGYVWQRDWTESVREGVRAAAPAYDGLRVNAASIGRDGPIEHPVDLAVLAGVRARPVVRVDAAVLPDPVALDALLAGLRARWVAAGVVVPGVEVDHDCATSQLAAYAHVLAQVDARPLSVTALPTWLSDPAGLGAVVAAADEVVLQVHAVDDPREGLFDPARAARAVERYRAIAPHLWVALPAYGLALADGRELRVEPSAVIAALRQIRGVEGIVWFRVPVPGDPRAWSLEAWSAVRDGVEPRAEARVVAEAAASGATDLRLVNEGAIWAWRPERVTVRGACSAADGLAGYAPRREGDGFTFVGPPRVPLDPGAPVAIGWVRCDGAPAIEP